MKLSYILLLVLVAMVTAESHDYDESSYSQEEPQSNYYNRRSGRPSKKGGIIGAVKRLFGLNANRRQTGPSGTGPVFTAAGTGGQFVGQPAGFLAPATTGGGFPLPLAVLLGGLALAGIAGIIGAAFLFSQLNNSGRGLDTDEWEVDHSVWMDQLQKDFEDSWSTEN